MSERRILMEQIDGSTLRVRCRAHVAAGSDAADPYVVRAIEAAYGDRWRRVDRWRAFGDEEVSHWQREGTGDG